MCLKNASLLGKIVLGKSVNLFHLQKSTVCILEKFLQFPKLLNMEKQIVYFGGKFQNLPICKAMCSLGVKFQKLSI